MYPDSAAMIKTDPDPILENTQICNPGFKLHNIKYEIYDWWIRYRISTDITGIYSIEDT